MRHPPVAGAEVHPGQKPLPVSGPRSKAQQAPDKQVSVAWYWLDGKARTSIAPRGGFNGTIARTLGQPHGPRERCGGAGQMEEGWIPGNGSQPDPRREPHHTAHQRARELIIRIDATHADRGHSRESEKAAQADSRISAQPVRAPAARGSQCSSPNCAREAPCQAPQETGTELSGNPLGPPLFRSPGSRRRRSPEGTVVPRWPVLPMADDFGFAPWSLAGSACARTVQVDMISVATARGATAS